LATSIGYGAVQMTGGLDYLFGLSAGTGTQVLAIAAIVGIALISVVAGLDKGVKRLSGINMGMAAALWVYVLIAGPTLALLAITANSFVDYFTHLPALNAWIGREDTAFVRDWTVLYWAWWVSWAPFVGMFIARISYGRTVREFITWVLVIPTLIGMLWMSVLGGTALEQVYNEGYLGVANAASELALFKMLELLPFGGAVSIICMLLIAIFLITSADSGALVMDTITAGGKLNSPTRQRVFWCLLAGSVATALMVGGGMASMQALTISIGLPFAIVLVVMCVGLLKGLLEERQQQEHSD
ncbi:MAG: BCCT family transporter, partial [Pseudomonadota bacterium]